MIEQFYLIFTCPTTLVQGEPVCNGNEGLLQTPQTTELKPHHQVQFYVKLRTLVSVGESYPFA